MNPEQGEALAQVKKKHVEQLPIRSFDFFNRSDVAMNGKTVRRVGRILSLNRRLQTETFVNPREREMLEREAFSLDRQIDTLVYDLYALKSRKIKHAPLCVASSQPTSTESRDPSDARTPRYISRASWQ